MDSTTTERNATGLSLRDFYVQLLSMSAAERRRQAERLLDQGDFVLATKLLEWTDEQCNEFVRRLDVNGASFDRFDLAEFVATGRSLRSRSLYTFDGPGGSVVEHPCVGRYSLAQLLHAYVEATVRDYDEVAGVSWFDGAQMALDISQGEVHWLPDLDIVGRQRVLACLDAIAPFLPTFKVLALMVVHASLGDDPDVEDVPSFLDRLECEIAQLQEELGTTTKEAA